MDIRSFFGKQPAIKKKKSSTKSTDEEASKKRTTTSVKKETIIAKSKKKIIANSDATTTDDDEGMNAPPSIAIKSKKSGLNNASKKRKIPLKKETVITKNKKKIIADSDASTTDDDEGVNNTSTMAVKGEKSGSPGENRQLNNASKKRKIPIKKETTTAKSKKKIIDDSDATTTDDEEVKTPAIAAKGEKTSTATRNPRNKRRKIVLDSNNDDDDSTTDGEMNDGKKVTQSEENEMDSDWMDSSEEKNNEKSKKRKAPNGRSSEAATSRPRNAKSKSRKAIVDDSDDDEDNDDDGDFVMKENDDGGGDDDDDDDFVTKDSPKASSSSQRKAPTRKVAAAKPKKSPKPKPTPRKSNAKPTKTAAAKKKKQPPIAPKETLSEPYNPPSSSTSQCLTGLTFVFTGNMADLPREEAEDYVKTYGGRVTSAVSGRTNYLVCGSILEDGRPLEEGSKYKKATELGDDVVCILRGGGGDLYGLTKLMHEAEMEKEAGDGNNDNSNSENAVAKATPVKKEPSSSTLTTPQAKAVTNPYAKTSAVKNPYAKPSSATKISNPYAKRSNPSATMGGSPNLKPSPHKAMKQQNDMDPNALWADKYAPKRTGEILGNQENIRKLRKWLTDWEKVFNDPPPSRGGGAKKKKPSFGNPNGPRKAALLSGPPGIGKTTTATLIANESGRQVLELNASDTRSKKSLESDLGDVTGSQVLSFEGHSMGKKRSVGGSDNSNKRCIIMDEVDGMGAGDRSGMSQLIKMIKDSKVPIICICNDRQSQKMRSLVPYCLDLRYQRPRKSVIAKRAVEVGRMEGMEVEPNAAEAIAESCGNDIRQVLNCLQMWSNNKHQSPNGRSDMTYRDVKDRQSFINKDEILRVSMFDATKLIVEGRRGLNDDTPSKAQVDSFFKRTDAFFMDYNLMGLNVHQNYLKVLVQPFQRAKVQDDPDAELKCLEDMSKATMSMSDFAVAEQQVRSNWGLLPLCSVLVVKSGYHAGGENGSMLPSYPEFAGWLGKNSSRGKKTRLLQELNHHMNYKISADSQDLRLRYIPALRQRIFSLMMSQDGPKAAETIQFMDEYGLDRDDVMENLDEFTLDSKAKKMTDLDSKAKSAFTREYNKGIHKSQALVDEQGAAKTKRATATDVNEEDGDDEQAEVSDDDEEPSLEELQKMFKKSGGGKKKATGKKKAGLKSSNKRK